jgi:hypothetical protein
VHVALLEMQRGREALAMSKSVTWSGYLAVAINNPDSPQYAWKASAKLSVNKPTVSRSEIALKISVDLPTSLFVRPQLEAKITVPDHAVTPLEIGMEVTDNIAALIHQQTGFDVKLVPVSGKEGA